MHLRPYNKDFSPTNAYFRSQQEIQLSLHILFQDRAFELQLANLTCNHVYFPLCSNKVSLSLRMYTT